VSERGVFAVDRGIWDHDYLADDQPFSRREAWLWLLSEAAWQKRSRRIIGRQITLERGQLVGSFRFIASKWRWSEPRVRRFIAGLVSEQMIDATADAGVSVITIRNYDAYQRVSLPSDAMRKVDDDAGATQERRNNKDIENIEYTSSLRSDGAASPPNADPPTYPVDPKERLWAEGVDLLRGMDATERQIRPMIGKWLREARDDAGRVLDAIRLARDRGTRDPIALISRILQPDRRHDVPKPTVQDAAAALDLWARGELARETGAGGGARPPDVRLLSSR